VWLAFYANYPRRYLLKLLIDAVVARLNKPAGIYSTELNLRGFKSV
jgi:hypothetical protein